MKEISKRKPRILEINDADYRLTYYGKCLRDFLFEDFDILNLDLILREIPEYWEKTIEKHFSPTSQNEQGEVT